VSGTSDDGSAWDSWFRPEPSAAEFTPGAEFPSTAEQPPVVEQRPPGGGHGRRGGKRRKLPYVLTAVAVAAAAGITAVLVLPGRGPAHTTGYLPTGSSPGQDAQQTARAFLRAWDKGDLKQAANYTNHPAAARAALKTFRTYLHLRKLTGTVGSATAVSSSSSAPREKVIYAASASVAAVSGTATVTGTWHYHASLVTYQAKQSQYWYVAWAPDDLAPNLTASTHLAAVPVAPRVTSVTDAGGNDLTNYGDAGLDHIAAGLQGAAPPGHGTPGLDVEIQSATGAPVANTQAVVVAPGNVPELATTINGAAEQAARSAVGQHGNSSMVVLQPSTGKILAIANNAGFNDFALTAAVAPGSTMKTLTSTALFTEGVLNPDTPVACPKVFRIQGIAYHNDKGETEPPSTPFITDFAQSCNNAFSTQWEHLTDGRLAATAKDYYGLNQPWDIGIGSLSASYFTAPASASGSELAQEAFGEGSLTASPLAMASVAATIASGTFRQPYLASGGPMVTAKPLPATTDAWLKEMMRAVVTSGTAAPIGFGPDVYAKTGTADINGQGQPNSWLIAFEPSRDVAVACLVVDAGYGAQFAGPEVKAFLDSF
jgi:Penicillin binding protein transpeptidase domain/NTF2-like N-terminal transpeptidase domain